MRLWILVCACASLALVGCDDPEPGSDAGADGGVTSMDGGSDDAGAADAGAADADTAIDADVDGDGGQDGGAGSAEFEAFAREVAEESCRLFVECGSKLSFVAELLQSVCHPSTDLLFPEVEARLAAGTVVFDPDAASRCLEGYRASGCGDVLSPPPGCLEILVPTVAAGGSCAASAECIDGRCELGASCPGTCVALGAAGDACVNRLDCQTDLACYMGTCEAPHPEGGACASDGDCEPGLRCGAGDTCEPLPGDGQPCGSNLECAGASVCSNGTCGAGQAEGEACETGFTATVICQVGLRCDPGTETCVPVSLPGGSCSADVNCPGSFWCDAGTCAPLPVEGESCAAAPRCLYGTCDAGTCRLAVEGEACEPSRITGMPSSCESGLYCGPGDQCTPVFGEGEPCVSDASCGDGMQCEGGGGGPVCAPECTTP